MATIHAANIAADAQAALVAVAGGRNAEDLARRNGAAAVDVEQAFARRDIDGVVIASPNGLHVGRDR